jgi:hypothetical protein
MALTKLFQVVEIKGDSLKVWRTYRTGAKAEAYLSSNDLSDYMSDVTLTILPIWTNKSESSIKKMVKE